LKSETRGICPVCGAKISVGLDLCPVCAFRGALAVEDGTDELIVDPNAESPKSRFEHYQLLTGQDGEPLELGRGAMGVTYKAIDTNLRSVVALKVISSRLIGDELMARRFIREARAAASVRHPNVASAFYLGKSGDSYFYAMEFVEGESLAKLIERSTQLELDLALEMTRQIAAGLAAIHEQNLVHRDIKPSNVMVTKRDEEYPRAKIIDLGLAKPISDSSSAALSTPGGFIGTPEFASPEQIAGIDVDVRSDLYSLGVVLWMMLTGHVLFRGSPGEVMYRHQHSDLPLKEIKDFPKQVQTVLKRLLKKDPRERFESPGQLLTAMQMIMNSNRNVRVNDRPTARTSVNRPRTAASRTSSRGPKKVSIGRLPVTASEAFGRQREIALLNSAWSNDSTNIVTLVAWAGVGKSTVVNCWLRDMATKRYRSADFVFAWSFYQQGSEGETSSAEEFLYAAFKWFGDSEPQLGTAWEKGERLARIVAGNRTLLVLDGLEPLQRPPGHQEGRLRDPAIQAFLRELCTSNRGLCVITTRIPIADFANFESSSVVSLELEHLPNDAGALLLRGLGVQGEEAELQSASDEFRGHCLALTLLGSYLTDAFRGDIRCRKHIGKNLSQDVRQGIHAQRVMESYQTWFGEGPEVSVLRILGLFDRPVDEATVRVLLRQPIVEGINDSLINRSSSEWKATLARLRRARLLAGEDPYNPVQLDTHPLIREFFREQLRTKLRRAWRECNHRLYGYYQTIAPAFPDSFEQMEPLLLATIFGCNAGLFRETLHEVYIPRIQRGSESYTATVVGAKGALLSTLAHFFEDGRWGVFLESDIEGQSLSAEDQVFVLMQSALYLASISDSSPEAQACYERAESLCLSLNRPQLLNAALMGQWQHSLVTNTLPVTIKIADRISTLAQEHGDPVLMIGAYCALADSAYCGGQFRGAHTHAIRGIELWKSRGGLDSIAFLEAPPATFFVIKSLCEWHFGEAEQCKLAMAAAVSVAKALKDTQALVKAIYFSSMIAHFNGDVDSVNRLSSELLEISSKNNFLTWLPLGQAHRGWVTSRSGDTVKGLTSIDKAIIDYKNRGSILGLPYLLALKAEILHSANRPAEALEVVRDALDRAETSGIRWWYADLIRFEGVLLATTGRPTSEVETRIAAAVRTAREQESVALEKRAEVTLAEYRS
jgi:serine/threonine protein kinase